MVTAKTESSLENWLWLQQALGYGSGKVTPLVEYFGSPDNIKEASNSDLFASGLLTKFEISKFNHVDMKNVYQTIKRCDKLKYSVITPDSHDYPVRLLRTENPPAALFVSGELPKFNDEVTVAIVGTRKATEAGLKAAAALSARLARSGVVIVSGGALGIDSAAHEGALAVGGKTVALLACGIDVPYLKDNAGLRRTISETGCLISEYPPGTLVLPGCFRVRNRIMSGLSLATVIMEAGDKSGALLTASHALSQGRDVFVLPGDVGTAQYAGSNKLIRDGARVLLSAMDILGEYVNAYPHKLNLREAYEPMQPDALLRLNQAIGHIYKLSGDKKGAGKAPNKSAAEKTKKFTAKQEMTEPVLSKTENLPAEISKEAKCVYNAFSEKIMQVDLLMYASGLSGAEVLSSLTELELFGFVTAEPGGRYSIVK